jgi:hypothetical protein
MLRRRAKGVRRPDHRDQEVGENASRLQFGVDGVVGADPDIVFSEGADHLAAVSDADLEREAGMPTEGSSRPGR